MRSYSEVRSVCPECGMVLAEFHQIIPEHLNGTKPDFLAVEMICPQCLWYDSNTEGFRVRFAILGGHDMIRRNPNALYAIRDNASVAYIPGGRRLPNRLQLPEAVGP